MTGSRRPGLDFYFRIGIGIVLTCALFVRVGVASPVQISSSGTTIKSDHCPIKPRLLDSRGFDWSIHTQVFSALDSPKPVLLIAYSPEEAGMFHPRGPYSNRPPPRS